MQARQFHVNLAVVATAAIDQRHAPAFGKDPQYVLESIGTANGASAEGDDLVAESQTAAIGIRGIQDVAYDHAPIRIFSNRRTERGVIDHAPALQMSQEMLDLIDG